MGLPTPTNNWIGLAPRLVHRNHASRPCRPTSGWASDNFGWSIGQQLFNGALGTTAGAGGALFPTPQFAALGAGGWHWHGGSRTCAASLSSATKVGGLSVPASWANAPGARPALRKQAATKVMSTNLPGSPGGANAGHSERRPAAEPRSGAAAALNAGQPGRPVRIPIQRADPPTVGRMRPTS